MIHTTPCLLTTSPPSSPSFILTSLLLNKSRVPLSQGFCTSSSLYLSMDTHFAHFLSPFSFLLKCFKYGLSYLALQFSCLPSYSYHHFTYYIFYIVVYSVFPNQNLNCKKAGIFVCLIHCCIPLNIEPCLTHNT